MSYGAALRFGSGRSSDSEEQTKYSQSFEDAIPISGGFLRGIYLLRSEEWEGPRSRA